MPSNAYDNLDRRLEDIDQLLQAHTALTQFQRARKAAEKAGAELTRISEVVDNLVRQPGRGRRSEVDALNRAAIVLLSAHLQGYIEDLFRESAKVTLGSRVKDLDGLVKQALSRFSNPHAYRIDQLFASIGFSKITDDLSWKNATNSSVRRRLTDYIEVRNDIAHGKQAGVHKAKVSQFKQYVEVFAKNFDEIVGGEIESSLGKKPW